MKKLKIKNKKQTNNFIQYYFILTGVFILNLIIRIIFIYHGYITTDEGISLYNGKLAASGLIPFIDYNGWNSLIHDYFSAIWQFFLPPTIFYQRLFALFIGILVLIICLQISRLMCSRRQTVYTALFLTFGSLTYTYLSNIFYSTQSMTFFIVLTFYCLALSLKNNSMAAKIGAIFFSVISVVVRSQALPILFIVWIYILFNVKNKSRAVKYSLITLIFLLISYSAFLAKSITHTLYSIFWPFFASSILLYVANTPSRSFSRLYTFAVELFRDYGIFLSVIGGYVIVSVAKIKRRIFGFSLPLLMFLTVVFFVITGLIHNPADASYIYPVVPIASILAAYCLDQVLNRVNDKASKLFIQSSILFLLFFHLIQYPYYKILNTTLSYYRRTPHIILKEITDYVETQTTKDDEIITFYLPAVANANRKVPLVMNEGQGSITIRDAAFAEKFHLITIAQLQEKIISGKAKLIIFTDTFIHYFGIDETERAKTLQLITQHYDVIREFPDFKKIDGSNAKTLWIYRLRKS